ncbi:ceramide phosphoethanolamine synthase [Caerostris extrusa]|uniref:Ceramide phosphoethanolamine synthase n=1 Tax=Caerostris extrusa TaxID=172846 RepID=A0AAV4Y7Q7_CAEEX|nr:ceramide phosphoethanolamine synthase [Caerostris extrusa]
MLMKSGMPMKKNANEVRNEEVKDGPPAQEHAAPVREQRHGPYRHSPAAVLRVDGHRSLLPCQQPDHRPPGGGGGRHPRSQHPRQCSPHDIALHRPLGQNDDDGSHQQLHLHPAAMIFNEVTKFSTVFYFITPNMVSFIGILFAIGAGKCMCLDSRIYHCLAIFLFQMRTWCDALDGIVARCRIGMVQHVSLRNTSGYVVDGVADALGFAAFLIGCFQFLRTVVPKHKYYLPLSTNETCKECKDGNANGGGAQNSIVSNANTQRRVFYVVLCFGLQMAIGAFFWDHYINAYHNLLETNAPSEAQTAAQNDVLRSSITWILMWFWRLSNAHTFIQFLLFAIYINKLWEFLTWIQFVGFAQIFTLAFFTEMHLSTILPYVAWWPVLTLLCYLSKTQLPSESHRLSRKA